MSATLEEPIFVRVGQIGVCRFCKRVREGTAANTIEHWNTCPSVVAYYDAVAEGVAPAVAMRLAARAWLRGPSFSGPSFEEVSTAVTRLLAEPVS